MRIIYPIEEDRIRKGQLNARPQRKWTAPLDWLTLLGMTMSCALFGYAPLAIGQSLGTDSSTGRVTCLLLQAIVSCTACWLIARAWRHSRAYAKQNVVLASNVAAILGLLLGQAAASLFVWEMLAKP